MAVCTFCWQEMMDRVSCTLEVFDDFDDGVTRRRLRHRNGKGSAGKPCGDCGCVAGGFHHPGCDLERCPRCRRQAITCGCCDAIYENDCDEEVVKSDRA